MKNIEEVRNRLNRAISSGYSKNVILNISKQLDDLIVEHMKAYNKKGSASIVGVGQSKMKSLYVTGRWSFRLSASFI